MILQLHVLGMTCSQCEQKITKALQNQLHISQVHAEATKNCVTITYSSNSFSKDETVATIESLGYIVDKNFKPTYFKSFLWVILLILLSFLVLRYENQLSFDFIPNIRQSMGYGTLFLVGLLTSLHCIVMCGAINMSQCSKPNAGSPLKPSLLYNLGRVTSYTILGGIIGGVGSVFNFNIQAKGYVTLLVSILMMLIGLNLLKLFSISLPTFKSLKFLRRWKLAFASQGPFFVGVANGFMPCGPLQSMQLYALGTGSIIAGGLSMFYFSLGTFPLMFGLGFMSTFLHSRFSKKIIKYSGLLIFILAVSMFSRGAALAGIILPFTYQGDVVVSTTVDTSQIVEIDLHANTYTPIQVKKDIPVTFIIHVEDGTLNGCNNPLTIPSLGIEHTLVPGKNIIQFTPTEEGKLLYTCWMGMITSYIDVVTH